MSGHLSLGLGTKPKDFCAGVCVRVPRYSKGKKKRKEKKRKNKTKHTHTHTHPGPYSRK